MLTHQEREEISELNHERRKGADCINALRVVQQHRGWISDDSIQDISTYLEMNRDEVDSVATFYNLIYRRPVGKHIVHLCDSVSCWLMGATRLQEHLCQKLEIGLGETTRDGEITLLPIVCLGLCEQAPAMLVDHLPYGNLDVPFLDELLCRLKKNPSAEI